MKHRMQSTSFLGTRTVRRVSVHFHNSRMRQECNRTCLLKKSSDCKEVMYKPKLLQLVARVSSRVFVGPELCANEEWLDITQKYTVESFMAIRALRQWHAMWRPVVHWFLPECRALRATLAEARRIIAPVIQERRERTRKTRAAGKDTSNTADTVGWMDDAAKGRPYDSATAQLGLSFAAIHTTTEKISGLISDLCANAELFESLR